MKITPPESGSQPALGATGIGGSSSVPDASEIPIAGGYYGAGTVEEALAELAAAVAALQGTTTTSYWPMLALTSGPTAATGPIAAHLADTADAHAASAVGFTPAAGIAATDVQAAIVEDAGDLAAHLADTTDAHDASAVSVLDAAANFAGTDVEAVLAELAAGSGAPTGYYAVVVSGSAPPVAVSTPSDDEWVYAWVTI